MNVCKVMCGTCPFREGSKYAFLRDHLTEASGREGRICHSTGSNGIHARTGKKEMVCRGSRDIQLGVFAAMGFIESATDEAWDKKWYEMQSGVMK